MYVRVKDKSTGHELDVLTTDKRVGGLFEPVKDVPESRYPRPPKHNPLPSTAKSAVEKKTEAAKSAAGKKEA